MKSHVTVLLEEAVHGLRLRAESVVFDATFGSGGHAARILNILDQQGMYVGIDADPDAIEKDEAKLQDAKAATHLVCENFRNILHVANSLSIKGTDAVLADLGWRMEQFSGNGKGFSFSVDEPLVMTYGPKEEYLFTAYEVVNEWDEENLIEIIKGYGEERFAQRITKAIIERRVKSPIKTSGELGEIVRSAVPSFYQRGRIHPATKTFQAIRMAVNDELGALQEFIDSAYELLNENGRLAIITFHSIEDRVVKRRFKSLAHDYGGRVVTKKPIVPTDEALKENPRARSAKLRIIEKHGIQEHNNTL